MKAGSSGFVAGSAPQVQTGCGFFSPLLSIGRILPYMRAVNCRPFRIGRSSAGLGLFAQKPFKKGAYLVTYRGRRITDAQADKLEARGSRYIFEVNSRWSIDGSSRWNLARYVNHACRPNAESLLRKGQIVYVARKRIKPGDEITVDYGKDYFDGYIGKSGCRCAACHAKKRRKRAEARRRAKAKARRRG
jgi:SET domain-containing protein